VGWRTIARVYRWRRLGTWCFGIEKPVQNPAANFLRMAKKALRINGVSC
jgi:hypothetical protein